MGLFALTFRAGMAVAPWMAKWLMQFNFDLPFFVMGGCVVLCNMLCCITIRKSHVMKPLFLKVLTISLRIRSDPFVFVLIYQDCETIAIQMNTILEKCVRH